MHSGVIFPPGLYGNIWPSRRCVRPQENLTSWSGSSCRYPPAPCPCFPPAPASPSSWRTKDREKTRNRPPRRCACGFSRKSIRSGRRLVKVAQYALPVVFDFLYFQRPPLFLVLGLFLKALWDTTHRFSTSTVAELHCGFRSFYDKMSNSSFLCLYRLF